MKGKGSLVFIFLSLLVGSTLTGCNSSGSDSPSIQNLENKQIEQSQNSSKIQYTGNDSKAVITDNNSNEMVSGAYGAVLTGNSLSPIQRSTSLNSDEKYEYNNRLENSIIIKKAIENILSLKKDNLFSRSGIQSDSRILNGSCGGTAKENINIDDYTGDFSGNVEYLNFCESDLKVNGIVEYTGKYDIAKDEIISMYSTFENLENSNDTYSLSISGEIKYDKDGINQKTTLNILERDNNSSKVYQIKDYIVSYSQGNGYLSYEVSGKFYNPDYGYVDILTTSPFITYTNDSTPSYGVIIIYGISELGEKSSVMLTIVSSNSFIIEADRLRKNRSKKAVQDSQATIDQLDNSLRSAKRRLSTFQDKNTIKKLKKEISQNKSRKERNLKKFGEKIAGLKSRQQQSQKLIDGVTFQGNLTEYKCTADGIVTDILVKKGEIISPGTRLISYIKNTATLEGQALIQNKDIGRVHKKQKVKIKYFAYPYQEYGIEEGTIYSVAKTPSGVKGHESKYIVKISLDNYTIKVGRRNQPLEIGLEGLADIKTGDKRLIELVFRPISAFFKDEE